MTLARKVRRYWRATKAAVVDQPAAADPADAAAWRDAVALWAELFGSFSPLIEGADVLELGCGDARLLGAVLHSGARSARGFERFAYWKGEGAGAAWLAERTPRLTLHTDITALDDLEDGLADLILARELDGFLPLEGLEERLALLFRLLRPGGEAILRLRCGHPEGGPDGPGYGFMTPTAWNALMLSTGFEIVEVRRIWRDPVAQGRAAAWLPHASDDERLTAETHLHLVRPWESWELDALKPYGDQRRTRKRG